MIPSRFGNDIKPAVRRGFALVSLLGFACIALAAPARATTQFSDSFAYPVGALAGHGPPPGSPAGQTGWSAVNRNPQVTSPGLVFTGIASSGNKVTVTGITGNQGDIAAANLNHVGGGTSTVWLAFLIREASGGAMPNGDAVCGAGSNATSTTGPAFGLIFNQNRYGIDNNTGAAGSTAVSAVGPSAATTLLVAKLDFNLGMEYLFVNPSTSSTPNSASANASLPMTSSFKSNGFDFIVLAGAFNTASFDFDQVRVGTTFADVVPPLTQHPATDFNLDGKPDYVLYNTANHQTAIWYLNNNAFLGASFAPTLPAGWQVAGVADFNGDGKPDYALFNPTTRQTAIWYLSGPGLLSTAFGPQLPPGWALVAVGDFNANGKPDFVLYNASTRQTGIWYLNNNIFSSAASTPTLPVGWTIAGVADFNRDGKPDYLLFNASTRQSAIWYLSGATFTGGASGPTLPSGYVLSGTADFDGDGKPDLALVNPETRQTAIWYLNNNVFAGGAIAPSLPAGWSLVAP